MKILKNILTFILVCTLSGFFIISSFSFGESDELVMSNSKETIKITPSIARIVSSDIAQSYIQKESYKTTTATALAKGDAGHIEFWLLATAFVLTDSSGSLDFQDFSLSWKTLTFHPKYPTVFSLYDPFSIYKVSSGMGDFDITQVTNWSFYVGTEEDGTISVYSVDAVIRLDLLAEGKSMTDMVLFPGMYIRFDSKMNKTLDGANLFRVLQSLEPDGTQDTSSYTTGIEFVNPRMSSTTDNKDAFFMYKLPIRTNILFQMLHVLFYDQVSHIDLFKEYGSSAGIYNITSNRDDWLMNPGKKSHFLLLKLDSILANALQNTVPIEVFRRQISEINTSAQTLAVGNDIQIRLERFLTDGRFALFGWGTRVNPQFAEIYQAVSEEVWKAPVTAHAQLLQKLSDIYSKNLVAQKKDLTFSRIDTYSPTALELAKTLESSDIEQRDYFDIALYAFNVLKKAEDRWLLIDEAVYAHPTYSLIQTILFSTDKYVNSITDSQRKNITYQWIALHFYDHMLSILTRSVYHTFMMEDKDGYLYLKSAFRPTVNDPKIHIDAALIRDFQNIAWILTLVSDRLDAQYGVDSKNSVFLSIKKSITLFHGFSKILDYESYNEYVKLPYVANTTSETALPSYTGWTIEASNPSETIRVDGVVTTDPAIDRIVTLLQWIPRNDVARESDFYRVNATMFTFPDPVTKEDIDIALTVVFDSKVEKFSNLSVRYKWKIITVSTDKSKSEDLLVLLWKLPEYISRLNTITSGNPSLQWDIRFLENSSKITIGVYPFPLVP